jgi:hypothetical protein
MNLKNNRANTAVVDAIKKSEGARCCAGFASRAYQPLSVQMTQLLAILTTLQNR